MVLDFIDKRIGFPALTDEEYEEANEYDITITQRARETLEYNMVKVEKVIGTATNIYNTNEQCCENC